MRVERRWPSSFAVKVLTFIVENGHVDAKSIGRKYYAHLDGRFQHPNRANAAGGKVLSYLWRSKLATVSFRSKPGTCGYAFIFVITSEGVNAIEDSKKLERSW